MKHLLFLLPVLLLCCFPASGSEVSGGAFLEQTAACMKQIRTFQCVFEENKNLTLTGSRIRFSGLFSYERNGRIRLYVFSPLRWCFEADKKFFRFSGEDPRMSRKFPLKKHPAFEAALMVLHAFFSGDFQTLQERCELEMPDAFTVRIRPKKNSLLSGIVSVMNISLGTDHTPVALTWKEMNGDVSTYLSRRVRINQPLEDPFRKGSSR